jgi:hypothetical protein
MIGHDFIDGTRQTLSSLLVVNMKVVCCKQSSGLVRHQMLVKSPEEADSFDPQRFVPKYQPSVVLPSGNISADIEPHRTIQFRLY